MAQKAKDKTEKAQEDSTKQLYELEKELLNTIENKIDNNESLENNETDVEEPSIEPTDWIQKEDNTITNGIVTLNIGDYINYDCTTSNASYTSSKIKTDWNNDQVFKANEYELGWRLLGVDENKQLMLLSEDVVYSNNEDSTKYYLNGKVGYENGIEELNKICAIYGEGLGAKEARSINVDDVNKITGYNPNNIGVKDPMQTGSGIKCYQGKVHEYGNKVKYTLTESGIKYETSNGVRDKEDNYYKALTYYNESNRTWVKLNKNESVTLEAGVYTYYPTTLTDQYDETKSIGLSIESKEYNMIFKNNILDNEENEFHRYWLASKAIEACDGWIRLRYRTVSSGIGAHYLVQEFSNDYEGSFGIRPVVTLLPTIQLKKTVNMKNNCKIYDLIIK